MEFRRVLFRSYLKLIYSDARLQISFKYQIFGPPAAPDRRQSWEQGIHFAYTQRMFWDLGAKSSPFRNIDFMPALFYLAPTLAFRSEERSVGKEFVSTCRSRGLPNH